MTTKGRERYTYVMPRRNHYFERAEKFHHAAVREFAEARGKDDEIGLAQAAEKGWGAVQEAAKGLFDKLRLPVPKGTTRIESRLDELQDRRSDIRDAALSDRFGKLMKDLHIDCFGDGMCSVKTIDRDLRKVAEFIQIAKRL